jgi:guanylate kinase
MFLVHLGGHSGAGKSRLLASLKSSNLLYHRHILYTSRPHRVNEVDGQDYYFRSREAIEQLSPKRYLVQPVRRMLQAVDIDALETDLKTNRIVIVELFYALWPNVKREIMNRLGEHLKNLSIFLTAVDPALLKKLNDKEAKSKIIKKRVETILKRRGDDAEEIRLRADSAVVEVLGALENENQNSRIVFSAPEGPDGYDDWTREVSPVGQAAMALKECMSLIETEVDSIARE